MNSLLTKIFFLLLASLLVSNNIFAHDVALDLENMSNTQVAALYLKLGYTHILPLGLDHILFILSLYLLNPNLKSILWQATAFTIAHSITLGLSMYKVVELPSAIVEPIIALSILYVALENIFSEKLKKSRLAIVFVFGLIHGLGFASALNELGLPESSFLSSLVLFNVGVELGQATVIIAAYLLFGRWFGNKPYYRKYFVIPISILIAAVSAFWTVERIL
jgi:hypothetical protein